MSKVGDWIVLYTVIQVYRVSLLTNMCFSLLCHLVENRRTELSATSVIQCRSFLSALSVVSKLHRRVVCLHVCYNVYLTVLSFYWLCRLSNLTIIYKLCVAFSPKFIYLYLETSIFRNRLINNHYSNISK